MRLLKLFRRKKQTFEPKLEISNKALNAYFELCPRSTRKCKYDIAEIKYKIRRAVDLGKTQKVKQNGTWVVGYYYLNFIIHNDVVVDITRKRRKGNRRLDKMVFVTEKAKKQYDREHKINIKQQYVGEAV